MLLLTLAALAPTLDPQPAQDTSLLLGVVPDDAHTILHCRDVGGLRARMERNDWYRLLNQDPEQPVLADLLLELPGGLDSDARRVLPILDELKGEVVFFETGDVSGFVAARGTDPGVLRERMLAWMPGDEPVAHRIDAIDGVTVEVVGYPEVQETWRTRAGHVAAFVDHPEALMLFSATRLDAMEAAVGQGLERIGLERRAPIVEAFLAAGGGSGAGLEAYVDLNPHVGDVEATLRQLSQGYLPDPSSLLGLEKGMWFHITADIQPGTAIDVRARLHLPPDTLVSALADCFLPLSPGLAADLPPSTWGALAIGWDVGKFYTKVREALEEAHGAEGLAVIDAGLGAGQAMGVDAERDLLRQLRGTTVLYAADAGIDHDSDYMGLDEWRWILQLGLQAQLSDGLRFQDALEQILGAFVFGTDGPEFEEILGFDVVQPFLPDITGGLAFGSDRFALTLHEQVLRDSLAAASRQEGAGLDAGSPMGGTIQASGAACFLVCLQMTPARTYWWSDLDEDFRLEPLEDGQAARDPFDSQFVFTATRTKDGLEFWARTR